MESRPVKTIPIHDHLRGKLCDLYENDCIFDKFECVWSGDDQCVFTLSCLLPVLLLFYWSFSSTLPLRYFAFHPTSVLPILILTDL